MKFWERTAGLKLNFLVLMKTVLLNLAFSYSLYMYIMSFFILLAWCERGSIVLYSGPLTTH